MDNFFAVLLSDLFSDLVANSSKKFRYFIVTICMSIIIFFLICMFVKEDALDLKIFSSLMILLAFKLYVCAIITIHKSKPKKNKTKRK